MKTAYFYIQSVLILITGIVVLVLPSLSVAGTTLSINNDSNSTNLAQYVRVLEDSQHEVTLRDILQIQGLRDQFKPIQGNDFIGKNDGARYWIHLKIEADKDLSREKQNWVLYSLALPINIQILDIYKTNSSGEYSVINSGITRKNSPDALDINHFAFPVELTPGVISDIYIMADNSDAGLPLSIPLHIYPKQQFSDYWHSYEIKMYVFYAVMLTLLIYNLCLFITIRQKVYFYYIIVVFTMLVMCAHLDGNIPHHFMNDWPEHRSVAGAVWGAITVTSYLWFLYYSLDMTNTMPFWGRVYRITPYYLAIFICLFLILHDNFRIVTFLSSYSQIWCMGA